MPFGWLTRMGPRNHVLDGVQVPKGNGQYVDCGGCPDHWKVMWVTSAVHAAKKLTSTLVKGTEVYPHMPVLRPHTARYIANVFKFHERRISLNFAWSLRRRITTLMFSCGWDESAIARATSLAMADSSDFWLLGEQSWQKFVMPCLGRRWTA